MRGNFETLPTVVKTITQEQLDSYAQVSGDHNPLHLNQEFAQATQFGGIIAHGMLTMAFISEMMLARFGRCWLETGSLNVRFKGAAFVGEEVEAWGQVRQEENQETHRRVTCGLGVKNRLTDQEIISGTATVLVPNVQV